MKHFMILLFAAVFFAALSPAVAQVPRQFSYQGVVLDATSLKPISDGVHSVTLKIYDGSTVLYTETQGSVLFTKGLFSVIVGSVTPIPLAVGFDKPYQLGITIDQNPEETPRTPILSAPYAMSAGSLASGAPNVVNSVNGWSGPIVLKGGGSTTITSTGTDTIVISSSGGGGGNGIQGVQNADPSISVTNPNGPIASVSVAPLGITTAKLADASVSDVKINANGISAGQVLTANGSGGANWQAGGGGLTLPFSGSSNTVPAAAFSVTNTGAGPANNPGAAGAGSFAVNNANNNGYALWATSNGTAASVGVYGSNTGLGEGGYFEILNPNSQSIGLGGKTQGLGIAMSVITANNGNASNSLDVLTTGTGRAGYFRSTNGANAANILEATTSGTGNAIMGSSVSSVGVYGAATSTSAGNSGVTGETASPNGYGVKASYVGAGTGNALLVSNGYMKVAGNTKTVYQHTTSAQNQDPGNINSSILSYPGMAQSDMLIITHVFAANRLNNGYGVWWNVAKASWEIFVENNPMAQIPIGEIFNVMVIKQ